MKQSTKSVFHDYCTISERYERHTYLILGGTEQVVPGSMEGKSSDAGLVGTHHLDAVASSDGPHTDGVVGRSREDYRLDVNREPDENSDKTNERSRFQIKEMISKQAPAMDDK